MSTTQGEKYSKLVQSETEPDDDTDDPDDGGDGGEEGEPSVSAAAPALGEVDAEKMGAAIEKANKNYRAALGKIDGLEFDSFSDCATCQGMGFVPPDFVELPPILPALDKGPCPACNALGVQETPSLVQGHTLEQCPKCNGNGWVLQEIQQPAQPAWYQASGVVQTGPYNGVGAAGTNPEAPVLDSWQRPYGHPHFGIPPASLGA